MNTFGDRFRLMLPPERAQAARVLILGCGGIGSYTGSLLARMGVGSFLLIDNDNVEDANVGTQDFTALDIGRPKVDALRDRITSLNRGAKVVTHAARIETAKALGALVKAGDQVTVAVAAVDNIEARRTLWAWFKKSFQSTFIDPRMGAEAFEMHVLTPGCMYQQEYEPFLKDENYAEEPCGATAIAYTGAFAGSMVASTARQAIMGTVRHGCVYADTGAFVAKNTFAKRARA